MENKLVKGLFVNERKENTPQFVIEKLSFKAEEFSAFLQENRNEKGYVNIDILVSQQGKHYASLNSYKKEDKQEAQIFPKKSEKIEELRQNVELQAEQTDLPF